MKRIEPRAWDDQPCLIVAVSCALDKRPEDNPIYDKSGYATLASANKWIRQHLDVKRRVDYKRGERPKLRELPACKAIVCVYGHYLYMNGNTYYSFFENEEDDVVSVWFLQNA